MNKKIIYVKIQHSVGIINFKLKNDLKMYVLHTILSKDGFLHLKNKTPIIIKCNCLKTPSKQLVR